MFTIQALARGGIWEIITPVTTITMPRGLDHVSCSCPMRMAAKSEKAGMTLVKMQAAVAPSLATPML